MKLLLATAIMSTIGVVCVLALLHVGPHATGLVVAGLAASVLVAGCLRAVRRDDDCGLWRQRHDARLRHPATHRRNRFADPDWLTPRATCDADQWTKRGGR